MNKLKAFIPNLLTLGNLLCGLLAILFSLTACTEKKNENIEEQVFSCFRNYFQSRGIDLEEELKIYESELIKEGILENSSAKSYINLYNRVATNGGGSYSSSFYNPNLSDYKNEETLSCVGEIYKKYYSHKDLTYIKLAEQLSTLNLDNTSPEDIAKIYQNVVGLKGFERKLYRAYALFSLNAISYDITKDSDQIYSEIEVFKDGRILLNGEEIKINQITEKVIDILKDIPSEQQRKYLVNLKVTGDVPYRYIDDIKTALRKADAYNLNYSNE